MTLRVKFREGHDGSTLHPDMCAMYIGANLRNTATDGILISGLGVLVKVNTDLIGLIKLFFVFKAVKQPQWLVNDYLNM